MLEKKIFSDLQEAFESKDLPKLKSDFAKFLLLARIENYLENRTFFHPLGFIYSKLFEFKNSNTLRLHVWDRERWYQEPLMDVHNHFYTVNSYVVYGKMTNNLYKIDHDKSPNYSVYVGSYSSNNDRILKKTDKRLNAEIIEVQEIAAGNLYHITTDKLHSSSIPIDEFTCTLVYTSDVGNPQPLVLGPLGGDEEYKYANRLVDKQTVDILVQKLIDQ